jgi:hypothetical protein
MPRGCEDPKLPNINRHYTNVTYRERRILLIPTFYLQ